MPKVFRAAFPDYQWHEWLFNYTYNFWDNPSGAMKYLQWVSEKLEIDKLDDWYNIPTALVEKHKGYSLVEKHKGLGNTLAFYYPHHNWKMAEFTEGETKPSKSQRYLMHLLKKVFPNDEMLVDFLHPDLRFPSSRRMELDVFIPSKNVAFEYQVGE
jgi:hypothetical protein